MSIERHFVHRATTTRAVKDRTPGGGLVTTWVPVLTAEPCATRPVSAVEKEKAGAELAEATDWVWLRGSADIKRDDRVTVAGTPVVDALVRFVEDPMRLGRFLRVALKVEHRGG